MHEVVQAVLLQFRAQDWFLLLSHRTACGLCPKCNMQACEHSAPVCALGIWVGNTHCNIH